jgi:hypothetical protein
VVLLRPGMAGLAGLLGVAPPPDLACSPLMVVRMSSKTLEKPSEVHI